MSRRQIKGAKVANSSRYSLRDRKVNLNAQNESSKKTALEFLNEATEELSDGTKKLSSHDKNTGRRSTRLKKTLPKVKIFSVENESPKKQPAPIDFREHKNLIKLVADNVPQNIENLRQVGKKTAGIGAGYVASPTDAYYGNNLPGGKFESENFMVKNISDKKKVVKSERDLSEVVVAPLFNLLLPGQSPTENIVFSDEGEVYLRSKYIGGKMGTLEGFVNDIKALRNKNASASEWEVMRKKYKSTIEKQKPEQVMSGYEIIGDGDDKVKKNMKMAEKKEIIDSNKCAENIINGMRMGGDLKQLLTKNLKGYEKVLAASILLGDGDYHYGNLVVFDDGTVGKIDHGLAFSTEYNHVHLLTASVMHWTDVTLDLDEYIKHFRYMTDVLSKNMSNGYVEDIINSRLYLLHKHNIDLKEFELSYDYVHKEFKTCTTIDGKSIYKDKTTLINEDRTKYEMIKDRYRKMYEKSLNTHLSDGKIVKKLNDKQLEKYLDQKVVMNLNYDVLKEHLVNWIRSSVERNSQLVKDLEIMQNYTIEKANHIAKDVKFDDVGEPILDKMAGVNSAWNDRARYPFAIDPVLYAFEKRYNIRMFDESKKRYIVVDPISYAKEFSYFNIDRIISLTKEIKIPHNPKDRIVWGKVWKMVIESCNEKLRSDLKKRMSGDKELRNYLKDCFSNPVAFAPLTKSNSSFIRKIAQSNDVEMKSDCNETKFMNTDMSTKTSAHDDSSVVVSDQSRNVNNIIQEKSRLMDVDDCKIGIQDEKIKFDTMKDEKTRKYLATKKKLGVKKYNKNEGRLIARGVSRNMITRSMSRKGKVGNNSSRDIYL